MDRSRGSVGGWKDVVAGVALDGALDLELIAELVVDSEFERAIDHENRVDSKGRGDRQITGYA